MGREGREPGELARCHVWKFPERSVAPSNVGSKPTQYPGNTHFPCDICPESETAGNRMWVFELGSGATGPSPHDHDPRLAHAWRADAGGAASELQVCQRVAHLRARAASAARECGLADACV